MSNNKQSSVEKMFQEMIEIQQSGKKLTFDENLALLEKYKAMHKEEIKDALIDGSLNSTLIEYRIPQYYNETFGGNND